MSTVTLNVEVLRSLLGVIEDLWDDPLWVFSGRGLSLHAVSICKVALVSVNLTSKEPDSSFGDRTIPMRFDLDELHDYLKSGDTFKGTVVLRIFEDEKILWCKLENLRSPLEIRYQEALDVDVEKYRIEEVDEYDAIVKFPVGRFGVLMGMVLSDGDEGPGIPCTVEISVKSDYIQFGGKNFRHRFTVEHRISSFNVKKPVLVNCNLELLKWVFQARCITDSSFVTSYDSHKVTLSLHSKSRIKVEFNIADQHTICYYLVRSQRTV